MLTYYQSKSKLQLPLSEWLLQAFPQRLFQDQMAWREQEEQIIINTCCKLNQQQQETLIITDTGTTNKDASISILCM